MKKTLKLGLNVFLISLILSSCSSCKKFNWKAKPWVGDSGSSRLVNELGQTIMCNEPKFDRMTCFSEENIAELVAEIKRINSKAGKAISKEVKRLDKIKARSGVHNL